MLILCKVLIINTPIVNFNLSKTQGTETSKYLKEKKLKKILIVTVSEIKIELNYQRRLKIYI